MALSYGGRQSNQQTLLRYLPRERWAWALGGQTGPSSLRIWAEWRRGVGVGHEEGGVKDQTGRGKGESLWPPAKGHTWHLREEGGRRERVEVWVPTIPQAHLPAGSLPIAERRLQSLLCWGSCHLISLDKRSRLSIPKLFCPRRGLFITAWIRAVYS